MTLFFTGNTKGESEKIEMLEEKKDREEQQFDFEVRSEPEGRTSSFSSTTDGDSSEHQSETTSNGFEIITNCEDNEDSFLDVRIDAKTGHNGGKDDSLSETKNLMS